ncbi:uncharacterized protein BO87DRAFT_376539 [Aspergillus neoniger CBS 115656]|uniref:Rhodopsin domain-containing protein n=1 Tax=Aspergillus neoniger (strain CBS 115656) TaxID=1448310 RepID=A0A318YJ43_ASPNB|nr:hypothetical protein BO87DRAFT_376539 [Aspergillus neoniger CBS 115656]PYH34144.1 hypothetical protein BO87DRAFT_376539 [Aspergillus neoniger CBS 115656]
MPLSSCGISFLVWNVCFNCLTTTIVALRLWANYADRKGVRLPDYMMLVAYVSLISKAVCEWWCVFNGLGNPAADLTTYEVGVIWKFFTAASVTWLFSSVGCKLSMLSLYLTLFGVSRQFRTVIYVTSAIVTIYFLVLLPLFLTNCHPLSYGWNPVPGGGCRDLALEEPIIIAVNILLDGLVAVLPIPVIWKLRMPLQKKITIVVMFSLGLSVVAVLIWRLVLTVHSASDFSISTCQILLPSALEIWLSLIVVSLPPIAPLFQRHVAPRLAYLRLTSKKEASDAQRHRAGVDRAEYTIGGSPQKRNVSGQQGVDQSASTTELVHRSQDQVYTGKIGAVRQGASRGEEWDARELTPGRGYSVGSMIEIRTDVSVQREEARQGLSEV